MKSALRVVVPFVFSLSACRAPQVPEGPRPARAPLDGGARIGVATVGTAATAPTDGATAPAIPITCRPDRAQALSPSAGRARGCVIDIGSRNVKLLVASMEDADPRSIKGDRICRSRLQLGEKTFDQTTRAARPLEPTDQESLARLLADYVALCNQDGGNLAGAVATEWARRATNGSEIRDQVRTRSGVGVQVLSREDEARYGYLAATRGAPGKIVIDFGSRSLQLSYWPRGAAAPVSASVPLGIDEAGDRFFGKRDFRRYGAARAAFSTAVRTELAPQIAGIRRAIRASTVSPELFSLGENGDIPLALAGKLWEGTKGLDEEGYSAQVKARVPTASAEYGPVTAVLSPRDLAAFAKTLENNQGLFDELRSDRLKRIYGYKLLAVPALVTALTEDLNLAEVVMVPQEMAEGLFVDKLRAESK